MIVYTSISAGTAVLVMLISVKIYTCSLLYVGIKLIESTTDIGAGITQSV
jgi:hypothetical protein